MATRPGRAAFFILAGIVIVAIVVVALVLKSGNLGGPVVHGGKAYENKLASFLRQEHAAAAAGTNDGSLTSKDWARVPLEFRDYIGQQRQVEDPTPLGLTFVGIGESAVPGQINGRSGRLKFVTGDSNAGTTVSLWLQRYNEDPNVAEDKTFELRGDPAVYVWRRGGAVYYMIAPASTAELRTLWGAPAATQQGLGG